MLRIKQVSHRGDLCDSPASTRTRRTSTSRSWRQRPSPITLKTLPPESPDPRPRPIGFADSPEDEGGETEADES